MFSFNLIFKEIELFVLLEFPTVWILLNASFDVNESRGLKRFVFDFFFNWVRLLHTSEVAVCSCIVDSENL